MPTDSSTGKNMGKERKIYVKIIFPNEKNHCSFWDDIYSVYAATPRRLVTHRELYPISIVCRASKGC